MPRPSRKKIAFTEKSLNDLYQEVYNDQINLKIKIVRLFNKWEASAKNAEDINLIAQQILKAIDCEAKVGDQKIIILKVLKDIIKDKTTILSKVAKGKSEDEKENEVMNADDQMQLLDLIERSANKKQRV